MPVSYSARFLSTTNQVRNAMSPRMIQVTRRTSPVSVKPANTARRTYPNMAAKKRKFTGSPVGKIIRKGELDADLVALVVRRQGRKRVGRADGGDGGAV
jgi:hypothetical protein